MNKTWKVAGMLTSTLVIAAIMIVVGLWNYEPPSNDTFHNRAVVLLLGLGVGGIIVCVPLGAAHMIETERFLKEVKGLINKPNAAVRLPFSRRPITHEEWKKMWGEDDPQTFRPR